MGRDELSLLYSSLSETGFSFIPPGRLSLKEIYIYIKREYPDLCDDSYLCRDNCTNGANSPEWKHRVRAAIWDVKDKREYVKRDNHRGFWVFGTSSDYYGLPEEALASNFSEGHATKITVNRYERSASARSACINHHGTLCAACGIRLSDRYGPIAHNLIHVHHLNPLALLNSTNQVDPINDLVPVCPNCHAVIHLRDPPFTITELRSMVRS